MAYDWNSLKAGLQTGITDKGGANDFNDPREWKLQRDADDNGLAVIRLMPGKGGNTPPIVRIYEHSLRMFHKPTNKYRWYIHASPASISQPCPASDVWYELGNVGTDEAKKMQKDITRSTRFISNILVVNDPSNPENNGKVFFWKYGVKLFEKFQAALEPTEAQVKIGKKPTQLFDPMAGADIVLTTKKVAGFVNYDDTTIEQPRAAFNSQDEADACVNEQCIDLNEFISPSYYKAYNELLTNRGTGLARALAGTPMEALLIASGSKVITAPYNENENAQGSASAPDAGATPPVGGMANMVATTPTAPVTPADPTAPVTSAQAVETPTPAPTSAPTQASGSEEDDIKALLDDL